MRWRSAVRFRLSARTERQTGRRAEKRGIRGTRAVMRNSMSRGCSAVTLDVVNGGVLSDGVDPSVLPDDWICKNNTDPAFSSCSAPEEKSSVPEEEVFFYRLVPGSLVWGPAKWLSLFKCHVTYFGEPVTRAWVVCSRVRDYADLSEDQLLNKVDKDLKDAIYMAKEALRLSLKERLVKFGFCSRYVSDRESSEDSDIAEMLELFCGNDCSDEDSWSKKSAGRKQKERKREGKRSGRGKEDDETYGGSEKNKRVKKMKEGKEGEKKKRVMKLKEGKEGEKKKRGMKKLKEGKEGEKKKRGVKKLKEGKEVVINSVPVKGGKEKKCLTPSFSLLKKKRQHRAVVFVCFWFTVQLFWAACYLFSREHAGPALAVFEFTDPASWSESGVRADGDVAAVGSDVVVNAEPDEAGPSDEAPGVSGIGVVKDKNDDALPVITPTDAKELAAENTVSGVEVSNAQAEIAVTETDILLNDAFHNDLQSTVSNVHDDSRMETEQADFKVPLKRKKSGKAPIVRHAKKADITEPSDQDETESDSEFSDSSVSLSQSDFSGRHYEVDDIKLFLRATKNKRGVRINEYFPDIKQFVEKTRCFMMEGSFTNKEVYRLKKTLSKLNSELSNEDSEKA
ncbi:uncharacterized protein LOC117599305 [Pangasianodon hypophthalmus]|uniref:uncharacterized protein LOC117599305 n=1 Tax=Pangasianodon hypophthalmus TaxID=310915 RepID=UPI0023080F2E|nr:uncharacterized protein LOC117599305 [Pangasianodon hypophthalmus]